MRTGVELATATKTFETMASSLVRNRIAPNSNPAPSRRKEEALEKKWIDAKRQAKTKHVYIQRRGLSFACSFLSFSFFFFSF